MDRTRSTIAGVAMATNGVFFSSFSGVRMP
jgi:hypothetical protein